MIDYPPMIDRIKSILIDSIILIGAMLAITEVLGLFDQVPDTVRMVSFFLLVMYEPLCTAFGATLGHHKMEIRVRKHSDPSRRINIIQSFIRYVVKFLFGWLSFITIFFNGEQRALHDIVSGSVMIKV